MSSENLSEKQMKEIKGGDEPGCFCTCYFATYGGSSTTDNYSYNTKGKLISEYAGASLEC